MQDLGAFTDPEVAEAFFSLEDVASGTGLSRIKVVEGKLREEFKRVVGEYLHL